MWIPIGVEQAALSGENDRVISDNQSAALRHESRVYRR
jgi:hypothetical protein